MFGRKSTEVLVSGAGPVGLFAALCLAKRGIQVEIVDTGIWACAHSYALALHPQSLDLLRESGLLERVMESAYPVRSIGFYDGASRRAQVCVDGSPAACIAVLRQDALERLLESALEEAGVSVLWRHQVSKLSAGSGEVTAAIDRFGKESRGYWVAHTEWVVADSADLRAAFVVGADGVNSQVRRALGIDFPAVGSSAYYGVFEFKTRADLGHEMRVVLRDSDTSVLWPLPDGYCRWSFELPQYSDSAGQTHDRLVASGFGDVPIDRSKDRGLTADAGRFPVLDEAGLKHLIAERAPWFTGGVENLTWRTLVRFERRLAARFGNGRMWLAGDAAHLAHPAGVQSMNTGLAEAHDLADGITRVLREGASPGILEDYSNRWTATWRELQGMEPAPRPGAEAEAWVRENAGRILACLPAHGAARGVLAGQLGFEP